MAKSLTDLWNEAHPILMEMGEAQLAGDKAREEAAKSRYAPIFRQIQEANQRHVPMSPEARERNIASLQPNNEQLPRRPSLGPAPKVKTKEDLRDEDVDMLTPSSQRARKLK